MDKLRIQGLSRAVFCFVAVLILTCFWAIGESWGAEFKWPNALVIGTPAVGTSSHATATAWAPVLEQSTGMKVRITPEGSQVLRLRWLKEGARIDINMESASEVADTCMTGTAGHAMRTGGPFQIRIAWLGQSMPFGFFTRRDGDIKTVYDIKPGHRISYFTTAPASVSACDGLLAWAKVDKKDVSVVPIASYVSSLKCVWENKCDISYAPTTSPTTFEGESTGKGLHWLPIDPQKDPEGAGRFLKHRPAATFGICRNGVKSAIGIPMLITPFYLLANSKADTEFIYSLSKWLHRNFDAYKDKNPNCALMSFEIFRSTLDCAYLPVHEGTIKYLKEIGQWSAKDEARQKYNVDLATKYEKAYSAAISEADKQKIEINPENKAWVDLWANFKKDIPPIKMMIEIGENK